MKKKLPLHDAESWAREFVEQAAPYCELIAIAGSVRRQKPEVGDIEIVAIPRRSEEIRSIDLFGNREVAKVNELWRFTDSLVRMKALEPNPRAQKGEWYRSFQIPALDTQLDVFTQADRRYWGSLLAVRTGSRLFTQELMTQASRVGLTHSGHLLWRIREIVPTPTEESFFEALQIHWVYPQDRTGREAVRPVGGR